MNTTMPHTIRVSEPEYFRMLTEQAFIWAGASAPREFRRTFSSDCASRMGMVYADLSRLLGDVGWGHGIHAEADEARRSGIHLDGFGMLPG